MANVNITEVRLLCVPLEKDYKHTLYFEDLSSQTNYFKGKSKRICDDFTYQRKDGVIRVGYTYESIMDCNYVMYRNEAYSDKWFYAFITKMEYINEYTTFIHIKTDVIQTWLFDYTVKQCFVEREHVNDDTIGLHTYPEGLETGEYIITDKNTNKGLKNKGIIIGTTVDINSDSLSNISGSEYNGIFSGLKYYLVTDSQAETIIKKLANAGKSDAIVSIFMVPKNFIETSESGDYKEVKQTSGADYGGWVQDSLDDENYKPTRLNGYKPNNNKLLTYPYTYMLMSNNSGASAVYKYELFDNPTTPNLCGFRFFSSVTPGMSIRIVPTHYDGVTENNECGLNLGKFPVCSWNTDVYTNWLTQNSVNLAVSGVSAGMQIIGGVGAMAMGSLTGVGSIASGCLSAANTLGSVYEHSLQPPQAEGNINSGDVSFSAGVLTFTAYQMTIKKEYARIIDGYFDMYGYKVCRVKTPNKNHRQNYWFTKTQDANIHGNIPQDDLDQIKSCYNNGITFWRNGGIIGNYDAVNGIV